MRGFSFHDCGPRLSPKQTDSKRGRLDWVGMEPNPILKIMGRGTGASTPLYRSFLIVLSLSPLVSQAQAESGLASYYGYGRGHRGEMTCAHRIRPFGSTVTVSYSGRSIRCRVTDRGPFIRGRIIDLSVSAARALGMMEAGIVRVSVE